MSRIILTWKQLVLVLIKLVLQRWKMSIECRD
jgi:hypothetical protein